MKAPTISIAVLFALVGVLAFGQEDTPTDPTMIQVVGNPRAFPADKPIAAVRDMTVKWVSTVERGVTQGLVVVSNRVKVGTVWIHVFTGGTAYVADLFIDPKDLSRLLADAGAKSVEEFGGFLVDRNVRFEGVIYREFKSSIGFLDPIPFLAFTTTPETKLILE